MAVLGVIGVLMLGFTVTAALLAQPALAEFAGINCVGLLNQIARRLLPQNTTPATVTATASWPDDEATHSDAMGYKQQRRPA